MIQRMIEFSLKNRGLVLLAYFVLAAWGYWALLRTPIDAIPDLSENQVIVFTDWAGRSPQEVEDQITYPLTVNLQGLAGIKTVRSSSAFGFSMINLIFEDNVDLYFARTRVLEKLNLSSGILPEGVTPVLGPDATGVGQVYWYTVDGPYDAGTLHSLQHWFIRYQLNSVPGVAEVGTVGGFLREYQVDVDPVKLRAYNVPLRMVFESIQRSNTNVGAKVMEVNDTEMAVRGIGLIGSIADIENIVLSAGGGTPVYLRNVATVHLGPDFRRCVLDRDGKEAVGGVVVIRSGQNALQVIDAVKQKIKNLDPGLPPGVHITSFYDRSSLIHHAVDTLKHALIEEILLVTLAHVIFLWHFRSILIVTLPLPLAVSAAFLFMHYFGISSNIMSLGGIAIAVGVLVDAGIVVTENVIRHAEAYSEEHGEYRSHIIQITLEATRLVGRPIFFAMTIIILAFVPVFALTGMEGKLFHPLAFTKTFAMAGSTLIAVTLVPVLCTFLIRGKLHREEANPVMHFLQRRRLMLVIPAVFVIMSVLLYKIYDSLKEALHVMLAVPFALTGGIFLLKILGYNFSVAVWVGFIALFGTAVQTGVVMVIYLQEAVARKKQATGTLTIQGLHEAVMEGALLRLRPKVMTVSTVIAGLLPLMWSARTGAEVMKPLATPVLGGMVSSLLHVLIVTPVIFTWLREREIRRG